MPSYDLAQKQQAKALVIATGNARATRRLLKLLWDGPLPDDVTLGRWLADPRIEPDRAFMQHFAAQVKAAVIGQVDRLTVPLAERIVKEVASGKSLDVLNITKSWGIVVDKLWPVTAPGYAVNLTYHDNRKVQRDPMHTFAPRVVEAEGQGEAAS